MSWVRLDDGFPDGVKLSHLTEAQSWRWLKVLCYCSRFETDGKVPPTILRRFGLWSIRDDLVSVGLLDMDGSDEYWVHDFLEYNPSRADREAERERWKQRQRASRNGRNVTGGVTVESPGSHGGVTQPPRKSGPLPLPLSTNPSRDQRGRGWVDNLSQYTGVRIIRGEHSISEVYDPLGTEPVPQGWPHERPTRQEVVAALAERAEIEAAG